MNEWDQQFGLVHDCLRACVYGDFLAQERNQNGAWPSIMDMCYADAVISWNSVFGGDNNETHWKKFVSKISIPKEDKLKPFDKQMIIEYLGITDQEWKKFHKVMGDVRNTRIAHLNVKQNLHELPNITWAMHSCYLYREWLIQSLHLGNRLGYKIKIADQTTKQVVNEFKSQIKSAYTGL